jgi:formate C-acetyltransferase
MIKFFFTKFYASTRGKANGKNFYFAGQSSEPALTTQAEFPLRENKLRPPMFAEFSARINQFSDTYQTSDAANAENELTYLALEAYDEMNTTDPKLSVRFYNGTSERLYRQVAETIRRGRTAFVLVNDEVAIPAIQAQGKTPEEAREYLLIGCYEPAIEGREVACNMAISLNLAKGVELALNRGVDLQTGETLGPDTGDAANFKTYQDFENAYFTQLKAQIDAVTENVRQYEYQWPLMNPSPVLAGTFTDAVKNGRDIGQAGPKYNNTGCMGAGLATATDSLSAVKKAVFGDGICTMSEILDAIKENFAGYEKLRLYLLNRIPRWGNAEPEADAIAKRIADTYCACVNATHNGRGGRFVPSMFSLDHRYSLGRHTSALPDGRLAGEPISLNNAAVSGKDKEGVTALLNSLTTLDYKKIPNGSVTDVYLHPSAVAGGDGLNAFISLIKTYFARGGYGIQFNIFDTQTLIDAQKHPEKYQTLQIRVCGWNVYFVTMSAFEQQQYINANIHTA